MRHGLTLLARSLAITALAATPLTPAAAAYWLPGSYTNVYGTKGYYLYVPTSYNPAAPMPLVVAIHGCTQDPASFAGVTNYNALAESQGFLVLYPDQPFFANPSKCWNVQYAVNQARSTGEPSIIQGMVAQVKAGFAINNKRVYVTGFSSGGAMTSILLACYPDVYAAGSVNAGLMYQASSSDAEQAATLLYGSSQDPNAKGNAAYSCGLSQNLTRPLLVFHGTWDAVVNPFNGNQTTAQFAQTNDRADDGSDNGSVTATWTTQTQGQVPGGRPYHINNFVAGGTTLMREYRIYGMGHVWSGGNPGYPYADATGPNATSIQWAFFAANPRP